MAKKKIFGIGNSSSQALTDTVSAANHYSGDLHIEVVPLRKIELDPENPRDLILDFHDVSHAISKDDKYYTRKISERNALQSMANSIRDHGVINPVLVYKQGDSYKLIAGERRTLASTLAGKVDVPAKILPEKPGALKLSLLQWVENVERTDLSLWERLCNLEKILDAYALKEGKERREVTPSELSVILSCSPSQAVNYIHILFSSEKLKTLIKNCKINSIDKAAFIAKSPIENQDELISLCLSGGTVKQLKSLLDKKPRNVSVGRPAFQVKLGTTKNIRVAKIIMDTVLAQPEYAYLKQTIGNIDWDNFKIVNSAFSILLKKLESFV